MSKRCSVQLGDVISVKHGFAFPGAGFTDDPCLPTLVTPGNFAIGGGFKPSKPKTFRGSFPEEYLLAPGDLVITMTDLSRKGATLGLPAVVPAEGTYLHNQRIGLVQIHDSRKVEREFLHYYLRTNGYRAHILGTATGSTVRHTSPTKVCSFVADLPSADEQRAIAEVLGALDAKIAANTRLRASSEELAHSEFRRLMAATTKTATLGDLLTLEYGKSLPASRRKDGTVEVYGSGGIVGMHDAALLDGPGVVVGRKGTAGAVHWAPGPFYAIDTTFYAVPERDVPLIFCYYVLRALPLSEMNSDSAVPGLKRNEAHATMTKKPDKLALARFADKAMTLFDQSRCANVENSVLAELRDALLPQLMSGKIRVKDAEKSVGEVL
jgi:type I restriction enzyme S subunit